MKNLKLSTEVEVKECDDGSGDIYFEIPSVILKELGWSEGDDVKFDIQKNGSIRIRKVKYENIELDFDDEELFRYMKCAHDNNISFNEFVELALRSAIKGLGDV